jgi:hypothetical protein
MIIPEPLQEKLEKLCCDTHFMDHHIRSFSDKPRLQDLDLELRHNIFDLLHITGEDAANGDLRIIDHHHNIILVHYLILHPKTYHVRGIVFDISNPHKPYIVATSYPYMPEFSSEEFKEDLTLNISKDLKPSFTFARDFDSLPDIPGERISVNGNSLIELCSENIQLDSCDIKLVEEGTALRIFYAQDRWYVSTHKKLNGRNSKWCGPSFGEIFDILWGDCDFDDFFLRDRCYTLSLAIPDNRLVCRIDKPTLNLTTEFKRCEDGRMNIIEECALLKRHPCVTENSHSGEHLKELFELDKDDSWQKYSGLSIIFEAEGITHGIKIVSKTYQLLRALRGNEPNFVLRYLQLKYDGEDDLSQMFVELFPEKKDIFDKIESDLKRLPQHLLSLYKNRYHYSKEFSTPGEENHIITAAFSNKARHSPYKTICHKIDNSTARQLNALIRHMNKPERYYHDLVETLNSKTRN